MENKADQRGARFGGFGSRGWLRLPLVVVALGALTVGVGVIGTVTSAHADEPSTATEATPEAAKRDVTVYFKQEGTYLATICADVFPGRDSNNEELPAAGEQCHVRAGKGKEDTLRFHVPEAEGGRLVINAYIEDTLGKVLTRKFEEALPEYGDFSKCVRTFGEVATHDASEC